MHKRGDSAIGIGRPGSFLAVEQHPQLLRARERSVGGDRIGEHPHAVPGIDRQFSLGEPAGQLGQPVGPGGYPDAVAIGHVVEGALRGRPVAEQARAHRQGIAVAHQQRREPAGCNRRGHGRQQQRRIGEVHQDAVAQDRVELLRRDQVGQPLGLSVNQPHLIPD